MTNAQRDLAHALERCYSGDQSLEAGCVLDALTDMGWRLERMADPVAVPDVASTRGLPRRRTA
jgi:hypothetical protein